MTNLQKGFTQARGLVFLVEKALRTYRREVAVVDGPRAFTFGELDERSARLANFLQSRSEAKGRVAVLMENRAEFVEADLAILRAGLAKVPINPRLSFDERRFVLEDSGAGIVIADAGTVESARALQSEVDGVHTVLDVGNDADSEYERVLASASSRIEATQATMGAGPSVILYTSGTTGRPKGATSSFESRQAAVFNMLASELRIGRNDSILHAGPLSHGSGSKVIPFLLMGAKNLLMGRFEPDLFLRMAEELGATSTFLVPTMIAMLTEAARAGAPRPSALAKVSYGGAPIAEETILDAMDMFGPVFTQVYGSCEAPHPVTVLTPDDHVRGRDDRSILQSAGHEALGLGVRLVDENGDEVAPGDVGELTVAGDGLMVGYWNNPAATSQVLRDGWYSTGDMARRDDENRIHLVDRKSGMIISGGLNIYPAEIERVLMAHPGVAEAAVIGVPDQKWGQSVHAFVVSKNGHTLEEEAIIRHCREFLAGYKKPRTISFVESLPRGSTGKIVKESLKTQVVPVDGESG